jgi:hypothetical protein
MSKTAPTCKQSTADEMRARGYTEGAVAGIEHIRELDDARLLTAAREEASQEHAAIVTHLSADGTWTNPSWVTSQCAEEAYKRGLIDERELDWLMR